MRNRLMDFVEESLPTRESIDTDVNLIIDNTDPNVDKYSELVDCILKLPLPSINLHNKGSSKSKDFDYKKEDINKLINEINNLKLELRK